MSATERLVRFATTERPVVPHGYATTERLVRFASTERPVVPHGYATTERLDCSTLYAKPQQFTPNCRNVNTATQGSRVKHPGTGPLSESSLQAVDLHTIEGSRADVRNTQSSRSDLQKKSAQSMVADNAEDEDRDISAR